MSGQGTAVLTELGVVWRRHEQEQKDRKVRWVIGMLGVEAGGNMMT